MVTGIHRAIVTRANGSKVRLRVPAVLGRAETPWAKPFSSGAEVPTVGSEVWVLFENGDPAQPVWTSGVGGGSGGGQDVIYHAADPDVARPDTASSSVLWIGSVEPNNALEDDLWYDTDALAEELSPHDHDTLYYTETEADALFAPTTHEHAGGGRTNALLLGGM